MPKKPTDDIKDRIMPLDPIIWVESPYPKRSVPKQERTESNDESNSESNSQS